jgi:4-hydroxy-tetrahydrodipicolinate reductase
MSRPLNAVIIGAAGRMGRALVRAGSELRDQLAITGAIASTSSHSLGRDAGDLAGVGRIDVPITDDLAAALARADVVIDFSQPHATGSNLAVCRAARKPLLIGTTGFAADLTSEFDAAAKEIPLLVAPNTSIGVTLLTELTRIAARALPADFDIEIVEAHHRLKKDAPSGTALALGKAAAEGRGAQEDAAASARARDSQSVTSFRSDISFSSTRPRDSQSSAGAPTAGGGAGGFDRTGERTPGSIGYAVIRGGDIVGDHTVLFAGTGEQVTLGHRATDRAVFARGALRAALWLARRPPGRYFMRDFIGLKTEA